MDEDQILQSIIADPQLTDPSIDVGQLRQTTPTRAELLADVPEFSGLKFDPTQRSYIEDLYTLYGGGAPMLPEPVVDTPVATTPITDTSIMDQPAGDSMLDTTPTVTTPTQTFADQPVTSITPGTTIDNVTGNITNPDGSSGGNIVDEFFTPPSGITGDPIDVGIPDNESGFVDPLGTRGGAPVISPVLTNQGPTIGTVDPTKAFRTTPLSDVELAEQGFLPNISDVTPPGFEPTVTINETPETFIDKTKNFLGLDNVDLPEFAIKAAINETVGKPITLAFDLAKNIFDEQTTQDQGVTPDAGFVDVVDDQGITADDAFDTTNEAATNVASVNEADVEAGLATESIADIDPADDFEVSGDVANVGTAMDLIGPAPTPQDIPDRGRGDTPGSGQISDAQAAANRDAARGQTGGGDSSGGKSIGCTAMYQTTGLEDWKKAMKIWYIYQKKYLTIQHQEGYHKLFKPFVKGMHKSKIVKAIGAHIAKHRTQHLKYVMFNSKPSLLGKIYNKILEPICYWVGKHG